jgi:hypothetical protein
MSFQFRATAQLASKDQLLGSDASHRRENFVGRPGVLICRSNHETELLIGARRYGYHLDLNIEHACDDGMAGFVDGDMVQLMRGHFLSLTPGGVSFGQSAHARP